MGMLDPQDYVEHVHKAQAGDFESPDILVQMAREPLQAYVFRVTLQDDLTRTLYRRPC